MKSEENGEIGRGRDQECKMETQLKLIKMVERRGEWERRGEETNRGGPHAHPKIP
jgi:hypothetical protein